MSVISHVSIAPHTAHTVAYQVRYIYPFGTFNIASVSPVDIETNITPHGHRFFLRTDKLPRFREFLAQVCRELMNRDVAVAHLGSRIEISGYKTTQLLGVDSLTDVVVRLPSSLSYENGSSYKMVVELVSFKRYTEATIETVLENMKAMEERLDAKIVALQEAITAFCSHSTGL